MFMISTIIVLTKLLTADVPACNEYKNPGNYGFVGGRNFYLTTKDEATLGVW